MKIITIRSPPLACESERGPALQEQKFETDEVRVYLLVDVDDDTARPWATIPRRIFARRADESEGVPRDKAALLPACYNDSSAVRAREALALSFVDEDLAPRAIPERIIARKSCARAYVHPPARSLSVRQAFSSCRRREQEPSTKRSRPSPESRRSKRLRAVSARTRRRPRPRKS
jgi:hypothetical protein